MPGAALETRRRYREAFVAGDAQNGAYVCQLVLSEPDGFTIQAGGPAGAFVAPAPREHGLPGTAALIGAVIGGGISQKLPVIPLATGVPPAVWNGKKDLPAYTKDHKEARWAEYQRDKAGKSRAWSQERWDNNYETSRNNNIFGLARERMYAQEMGLPVAS